MPRPRDAALLRPRVRAPARASCFQKVGGPNSVPHLKDHYGVGKTIDTSQPFDVEAHVGHDGALAIELHQGGKSLKSFDAALAGNPQGFGVPTSARQVRPRPWRRRPCRICGRPSHGWLLASPALSWSPCFVCPLVASGSLRLPSHGLRLAS